MARVRSRRAEIPPHPFRNDRHQSQLQKGAPFEWPEEQLLGAFNGKRNSIDSGDGLHWRPFSGSNSVLQNYAVLKREVPPPGSPSPTLSPPANPQRPLAPARTLSDAAPFCRESASASPDPASRDPKALAGQM